MFFGSFNFNLDTKGRVVVPSRFRANLPTGSKVFILSGFEGCISVFQEIEFEKHLNQINSLSFNDKNARAYTRAILASVVELQVDSHGRLALPKATLAKYKINSEVTIVGVNDHFEIWDKDAFAVYEENASANLEVLADSLEEKSHA